MDVQKEVSTLKLGEIASVFAHPKIMQEVTGKALGALVNQKNYTGVFITINRPYKSITKLLKDQGVDSDRIFFIDMITLRVTGKAIMANNCYFANSPQELMEISETLTQIAIKHPMVRFLMIDSVQTLCMYNDVSRVTKFMHFMTTALRELQMAGIFMAPQGDVDPRIAQLLSCVTDKTVEVNE